MLKKILDIFLSLRTAIWLTLASLLFLLFGSFVMPGRQEFQSINSLPLFGWMRENPVGATWWLWGAIAFLSLLAINTLLCSIESLFRKRQGRHWLLIISPQVIHIGFLFILLAHLLSSAGSFRGNVAAREGSTVRLPGRLPGESGMALRVTGIDVSVGPEGYVTDWRAEVDYLSDEGVIKKDFLAPNRPSFFKGLGVYLKDVQAYPVKACLLEISREPGAGWALIGAVFFMLGTVALVALKIKREA